MTNTTYKIGNLGGLNRHSVIGLAHTHVALHGTAQVTRESDGHVFTFTGKDRKANAMTRALLGC